MSGTVIFAVVVFIWCAVVVYMSYLQAQPENNLRPVSREEEQYMIDELAKINSQRRYRRIDGGESIDTPQDNEFYGTYTEPVKDPADWWKDA